MTRIPSESDSTARIVVQAPAGITRDLVERYISRCRSNLPNLRSALAHGEYEAARVYGHHLKGSGGAYGIPMLTQIGAALERAAKDRDLDALQREASVLEAYLTRLAVDRSADVQP